MRGWFSYVWSPLHENARMGNERVTRLHIQVKTC